MKKMVTGLVLLSTVTSMAFANSEITRLAGSWQGSYVDSNKSAVFILTVDENGDAVYSDTSSLKPYCKGKAVKDSLDEVEFELDCNKKVTSGWFGSSEMSLSIMNPKRLSVNVGESQQVSIDTNIMGLNRMNVVKLPETSYKDLSAGYAGTAVVERNGNFIGNIKFELNDDGILVVNSGHLQINGERHILGELEELIDGYSYAKPNLGEYIVSNNLLELNVDADSGKNLEIVLDLNEIQNELIYVYNLNKPRDLKQDVIQGTINGEDYEITLIGAKYKK